MRGFTVAFVLVLVLTHPAGAQTVTAKTAEGATACTEAPRSGRSIRCRDLAVGTDVIVTGPLDAEWLRVTVGGDTRYIERAKLRFTALTTGAVCGDSLYLALRGRKLADLTEREYQYFLERDRACTEYQRTLMSTAPAGAMAEEIQKVSRAWQTWMVVSALASVIAGVIIYSSTAR